MRRFYAVKMLLANDTFPCGWRAWCAESEKCPRVDGVTMCATGYMKGAQLAEEIGPKSILPRMRYLPARRSHCPQVSPHPVQP